MTNFRTITKSMALLLAIVSVSVGCEQPEARSIKSGGLSQKSGSTSAADTASDKDEIDIFLGLLTRDPMQVSNSIRDIGANWKTGYTTMLFEATRIARYQELLEQAVWLAESKTGEKFGDRMGEWFHWIWTKEYQPHPQYAEFKARFYSRIDERFANYFKDTDSATIRLDEIVWGGVKRDGIPPLKDAEMLTVEQATYLDDSNVVFGVHLNGESRCYPKRILAWHEMYKDTIGGQSVCGVY